ncbi:MAG: hypothetical protein WBC85_03560 [Planktotalea sp.]|uniref:hypothetical protein n=1 Tax=Planktotalea sp. TaxID=2029877 RepID=UPI003C7843E4
MKHLLAVLIICISAGTLAADNKYYRLTTPMPPEVEQNLPADVPAKDVLVQDGCFFYLYEGNVYPVAFPETPNQAICAG